jgi:DNA-binding SARP family transcriptional activator
MGVEYRLLGPLEVLVNGRVAEVGAPRHRGVLVLLLTQANAVVPTHHLIDELWGDAPPASAGNLVQGAVSGLRKVLGKEAIATRGAGYALVAEPDAIDLHRFERLAEEGSVALDDGHFDQAAALLGDALALWRGPALADLADESFVQPVLARLEELRLLAAERWLEAELGRGRHADVLTDIQRLAREHPLRERIHGLLMLALYRCGRQAEALEAYRSARATLVEELGISPGPALQELEGRILRQDPELLPGAPEDAVPATVPHGVEPLRAILVAPLLPASIDALIALAERLAPRPERELILVGTVAQGDQLESLSREFGARRERLIESGLSARAAAFTSVTPGADVARVAIEHDVDLLLVDAPGGLLEDARLLAVLHQAPCDVGVVVAGTRSPDAVADVQSPVLVPFAGASHDWAAVELGAWLAGNSGVPLRLAGASEGPEGRDASRLLASASLAVQHAFGVAAEPLLVDPDADALVTAAAGAAVVVVGLTERWRREGLGPARTALATRGSAPAVLVRRGVRPGGLAPRAADTCFTWTLAGR